MKDPKKITVQVLMLLMAVVALLYTRIFALDIKYAIHRPITSRELLLKIQRKDTTDPQVKRILQGRDMELSETLYLPAPVVLKLMAMGWNGFFADMLFIRAHSYFISHFFYDRKFPWLDTYYRAIRALDPMIARLYLWTAQMVKYGQYMDNKTILRANRYLLDGIKRFPEDPRFYQELGFNLYFEYKAKNLVDHELMRIKAREYFAKAASLPGSNIDPNFVSQLYSEKSDDRLALYYALTKYFQASAYQKRQLLYRISRLRSDMAMNLKLFETRWKKDMPFVDTNLFALLGNTLGPPLGLLKYMGDLHDKE